MKVKICGVKTPEDAITAARLGADLLGLNFHKPSPRYIEPGVARGITDAVRIEFGDKAPVMVGVFVNLSASHITEIINIAGLDFAQLSGDESDELLHELRGQGYKAIRPPSLTLAVDDAEYYSKELITDERIPSLLLDAYHPKLYGGTGETASVEVALAVKERVPRLMLAGGLNPDNIAERVRAVRPWGVDVASGVEVDGQPGVKDPDKVLSFIQQARSA